MLKGVFTALVTPFLKGEIDFLSLDRLIDDQIQNGVQGFVVNGTTAESPTLTDEESLQLLEHVCRKVGTRVPLIFGSGSNSTAKTIELSKRACEFPIAGLLVVVPYYNKPPQEGLYAHFSAVADRSPKPIILYNVPGRTITSLAGATVVRLAQHANIVGIKEASGNLDYLKEFQTKTPASFVWLSGDDESSIEFCALGGHGVISVCSHIAPAQMVGWIGRAMDKDPFVLSEFEPHKEWIRELYCASNPIPVKAALKMKGLLASDELRLPLVSLESPLRQNLEKTLRKFEGLL